MHEVRVNFNSLFYAQRTYDEPTEEELTQSSPITKVVDYNFIGVLIGIAILVIIAIFVIVIRMVLRRRKANEK